LSSNDKFVILNKNLNFEFVYYNLIVLLLKQYFFDRIKLAYLIKNNPYFVLERLIC
jgi:hypothetical protein